MDSIIIYGLSHIIEGFVALYFYDKLFTRKKERHYIYAYVVTYTILFLSMFTHSIIPNIFVFILTNFLLVKLIYKESSKTAFLYTIVLTIMMTISELIICSLPGGVLGKYLYISLSAETIFCFTFSKLLYAILVFAFVNIQNRKRGKKFTYIPIYVQFVFVFSCLILISLCIIPTYNDINRTSEYIIFFTSTLIILIDFIVLWLQDSIQKNHEKLVQIEMELQQEANAKNYIESLKLQDESKNILIHDIKNHVVIINEYLNRGNLDAAKNYLNELTSSPALASNARLTNNNDLNIILNIYKNKCFIKNIKFNTDINCGLNFMNSTQLTALFCNLLDNAMDAAATCEDAFISIIIRYDDSLGTAKISISNSCCKPPVEKNKRFLSAKRDYKKVGFGMRSIENIVNLYGGNIYSYYDSNTSTFNSIFFLNNTSESEVTTNA